MPKWRNWWINWLVMYIWMKRVKRLNSDYDNQTERQLPHDIMLLVWIWRPFCVFCWKCCIQVGFSLVTHQNRMQEKDSFGNFGCSLGSLIRMMEIPLAWFLLLVTWEWNRTHASSKVQNVLQVSHSSVHSKKFENSTFITNFSQNINLVNYITISVMLWHLVLRVKQDTCIKQGNVLQVHVCLKKLKIPCLLIFYKTYKLSIILYYNFRNVVTPWYGNEFWAPFRKGSIDIIRSSMANVINLKHLWNGGPG